MSSQSQAIPTRKVLLSDPSQLPEFYSSTPGGTLYSTTPGGTRIIYEKSFMMNLKNSPLCQTPPNNLPQCLLRGQPNMKFQRAVRLPANVTKSPPKLETNDQDLFELEL